MGCYLCGRRQVDPVSGPSPWRRGVVAGEQVLVCPDCQVAHDWTADLDRCRTCGSAHLMRRLGEVECRDCGCVADPAEAESGGGAAGSGPAPGLSEEVDRALARVLGRGRSSVSAWSG